MAIAENILKLAKDHHGIQMAVLQLCYQQREAACLFPNLALLQQQAKLIVALITMRKSLCREGGVGCRLAFCVITVSLHKT